MLKKLEKLSGGNLNHVWRAKWHDQTVIAKQAPPHIASQPEVSLSSTRITFEARALELFMPGNELHHLASDPIRPPRVLDFDEEDSLLLMEDLGDLPGLALWMHQLEDPESLGTTLGQFIGNLHRSTFGNNTLAGDFNNRDIQQVRNEIQYRAAAAYATLPDVNTNRSDINRQTRALGEYLLKPGRCLIMGDLWPPSILITEKGKLRLIDWEFAHFGHPLQDTGHFAAHCWMQAHTAPDEELARMWEHTWATFWESYQSIMPTHDSELWKQEQREDMAVHMGAEILVRANGPFKSGYLYEEYPADHPIILEAVDHACHLINSGTF